jgi:5'-nucleotidase
MNKIAITIGVLVLAVMFSSCNTQKDNERVKITILASNDVHSRIDPIAANDKKLAFMGGFAQRKTAINKVRDEGNEVLLLDAGDVFQGTPYFNKFGGELEYRLMSQMGYNAAAIGNHDLDNGIAGLTKQLGWLNFPLLSCNYDFSATSLAQTVKPYVVFELKGVKIGIIGVGVNPQGLILEDNYDKMKFLDPIATANHYAQQLKSEGCHYVVCLSHLGYSYQDSTQASDVNLAKNSENIDYIIGGHTHTFPDEVKPVDNQRGKKVLISQCGKNGVQISRIDLEFIRI